MNLKTVLIFLFLAGIFILVVYGGSAQSSQNLDSGIFLVEGKNSVEFDNALLVKELVVLNPGIEYVSYFDDFLNKQIAYVNVFGGVGDNFLIEPGKVYEISVKKKIELVT